MFISVLRCLEWWKQKVKWDEGNIVVEQSFITSNNFLLRWFIEIYTINIWISIMRPVVDSRAPQLLPSPFELGRSQVLICFFFNVLIIWEFEPIQKNRKKEYSPGGRRPGHLSPTSWLEGGLDCGLWESPMGLVFSVFVVCFKN